MSEEEMVKKFGAKNVSFGKDKEGNTFIGIIGHQIVNPETGKTKKEENLELNHKFQVGDLIEIEGEEDDDDFGVRLYIVGCVRDCDGSPLYVLGKKGMNLYQDDSENFFNYKSWNGYPEWCLKLIRKAN